MKSRNELGDLAKQFKKLGNRQFTKSEFWDEIAKESQLISSYPNEVDLISSLTNRANAYFNMGCCLKALADCDEVLHLNPAHDKCLVLKVKALWGLAKYEEALGFVEHHILNLSGDLINVKEFESLQRECVKMVDQSVGIFDIQEIMSLPKNKCNDVAEFTGPVEIAEIPGKGRGLIATSDISAGQLIICSKAFCLVLDDDLKARGLSGYNNRDYFLSSICQKLILEPSLQSAFFHLYPAPPPNSNQKGPPTKLNVELVDSIIKYNSFAGDEDPWPWADGTPNFWGLWLLPSYINHSCMDCNAYYYFYGDIMFIRAVKAIPRGSEVTITYTPPTNKARRQEVMALHNFKCTCQLCQMEETEHPQVQQQIEATLDLIRAGLTLTSKKDLNSQVKRIEKLTALRPLYPNTNMALLDPCTEMVCSQLANQKEWRVFADLFEKSHSVTSNNCYVVNAVNISIVMLQCYLHLGDTALIQKWIQQLKVDLVTAYGSIQALRSIKCKIINTLQTAGFDFFQD